MDNTPILMQSEEKRAPWNEKEGKTISVCISQTLSCETIIEVPEDFDEYDSDKLEEYVIDQIVLPSDMMSESKKELWSVDDFCVTSC